VTSREGAILKYLERREVISELASVLLSFIRRRDLISSSLARQKFGNPSYMSWVARISV
jgi:hypothetical protein